MQLFYGMSFNDNLQSTFLNYFPHIIFSYIPAAYTPLYAQAPVFVPSNVPVQNVQQAPNHYPGLYIPQTGQRMVNPVQVTYPATCSSPSMLQSVQGSQRFYSPNAQPVAIVKTSCSTTPPRSAQGPPFDVSMKPWQSYPHPQRHHQPQPQTHPQSQPQHQSYQPQPHSHQPQPQSLQPHPYSHQPHPPNRQLQCQSRQQQPVSCQQQQNDTSGYYSQTASTRLTSCASDPNQQPSENPCEISSGHTGFGGNPSIKDQQAMYQKRFIQNMSYSSVMDDCIVPLTEPERQKLFR